METLTHTQLTIIAGEAVLVVAGIIAWISLRRRGGGTPLIWDAPLVDTLFLAWAILIGAFLGQLVGVGLLRLLPESVQGIEAVNVIVIGGSFDIGCIAAWVGVHVFMRAKGQPLPRASEAPAGALASARSGGAAFLRALPAVAAVGLASGFLLTSIGVEVKEQDVVGVFARTESTVALAGMLVLAVILAPVAEELVFRAGLFRVLRSRIGRWPAIAISSMLFAALHLSWASFAPLVCLGALFCLAYERSRSIAVPMIAHALFNLNSIILILVLPPELLQ